MVKEASKVISEFNELVNMTADDLKQWLDTADSKEAGWTGGEGSGETVGHDSGNKIVKILESNPDKAEDKYAEEDIDHMRRVVSYCKRHLAQESSMAERKTEAELRETKSYKSLKNWGHDSLKSKSGSGSKSGDKKEKEEVSEEKEEKEEAPAAAGDKRKADEAQDQEDKAEEAAEAPEPKKAKEAAEDAPEKEENASKQAEEKTDNKADEKVDGKTDEKVDEKTDEKTDEEAKA